MAESTSTSAIAATAPISTPSPVDLVDSSSISDLTQSFNFSSGNPRIEETRGIMLLYRHDAASSSLPVERKPLVCVLGVPNHMTYADFCQFCGSFVQHILEMRIVRNDGMEDKYSVLIRFDGQDSTDSFYKHFNGRHFSSLEEEACHMLFTVDVQYTGSIEHAQALPVSSTEQPSCPVCLERLDQDTSGILTTICNHSFHCSCISKWTDSSCPVCRYCQQQPENSKCFICQTSENVWICVICGFVGCGRYKEGHAIRHWKETQHCYSLELETQRVWDYVGDNYVHRLIQSKTDGKLVELNHRCVHGDDGCGICECGSDPAFEEAQLNSKVEAIVNEYQELLTTQLENQKMYFESLLKEFEESETSEVEKASNQSLKLQKMQAKRDKVIEEKKFQEDINLHLLSNKAIWQEKILEAEARKKTTDQDDKIEELEEQLMKLMLALEDANAQNDHLSASKQVKVGGELPEISSNKTSKRSHKNNAQRSG
ncbi:BRAP2 RING ZnF UBP domain-containing protein 2 isoform X1 [Daucus carota subsp. sativus]|uniref:BRAP2 RING ZnF UBP domain-containing protein 2 isoform X1 n=1 Tax=Daucus carota subsp. sativus TaxID=79200 RepID=UPI0007EF51AE|nr:PREDICTED: BRCA1-associated protein isoform X1 [Daucus carota subsp. sativus]